MKRKFHLIFFFLIATNLLLSTAPAIEAQPKSDICHDPGDNFYVKETVTINKRNGEVWTSTDTCLEDGRVQEQTCCSGCNDDENCYNFCAKYLECPNGCANGACISLTDETCTDTDGGNNYYKKGKASGELYNGDIEKNVEDTCTIFDNTGQHDVHSCEGDGCRVMEWYCDEDGTLRVDYNSRCPEGCVDGRCLGSNAGSFKEIEIKGRIVDALTGKPVEGATLLSAYEHYPENVVTDSNGEFSLTINTDFKITEGIEEGQSDIGGSWSFKAPCYTYTSFSVRKDLEIWKDGQLKHNYELGLTKHEFDEEEIPIDISDLSTVELGNIEIYPTASISTQTDLASDMFIFYKYKNLEGYNGPGQGGYSTDHFMSDVLPLDYEVYIQFEEESGKQHKSSTHRIPTSRCSIIGLEYKNGKSDWSITKRAEPTESTGPIEVSEEAVKVLEEDPEASSGLCGGCLYDGKCYPYGYRISSIYCDSSNNAFKDQRTEGSSCNNNFECSTNVCIDSQCISQGLIRRVIEWFRRIF